MRRYLIAAAAAGGLLLLGGAPAYADANPAPGGGPLGGILDPDGGVKIDSPLGDNPIIGVKPGSNSPALPTLPGGDLLPGGETAAPAEAGLPSARTGLGGAKAAQPAADVVGQSPLGGVGDDSFSVANVPVGSVLSGGGLSSLGLMPDGSPAVAPAESPKGTPATEAGLLGGGMPLLGGLGGLLPEPARTLPADVPDTSGMPAGGTPADAPADKPAGTPADTPVDPAVTDEDPGKAPDPAGPGDDDKRLHEEPIDNEAGAGRSFSDGRPVAGPDPDFD